MAITGYSVARILLASCGDSEIGREPEMPPISAVSMTHCRADRLSLIKYGRNRTSEITQRTLQKHEKYPEREKMILPQEVGLSDVISLTVGVLLGAALSMLVAMWQDERTHVRLEISWTQTLLQDAGHRISAHLSNFPGVGEHPHDFARRFNSLVAPDTDIVIASLPPEWLSRARDLARVQDANMSRLFDDEALNVVIVFKAVEDGLISDLPGVDELRRYIESVRQLCEEWRDPDLVYSHAMVIRVLNAPTTLQPYKTTIRIATTILEKWLFKDHFDNGDPVILTVTGGMIYDIDSPGGIARRADVEHEYNAIALGPARIDFSGVTFDVYTGGPFDTVISDPDMSLMDASIVRPDGKFIGPVKFAWRSKDWFHFIFLSAPTTLIALLFALWMLAGLVIAILRRF